MKKLFLILLLLLSACSANSSAVSSEEEKVFTDVQNVVTVTKTPAETAVPEKTPLPEKIDLSSMSATICYSTVFDMLVDPQKYEGMQIKVRGPLATRTDAEGKDHYACIVQDATACCAQGLEFVLSEAKELPELGTEITIEGTFTSFIENNAIYILLKDAVMN